MKHVLIRFFVLSALWITLILFGDSNEKDFPYIVLLLTLSLVLHFLLPITRNKFAIMVANTVVMAGASVWVGDLSYVGLLFAYALFEATFFLHKKQNDLYIIVNLAILLLVVLIKPVSLAFLLLYVVFATSIWLLNDIMIDNQQKKEIHTQLLSEYRSLKRSSLAQEKVARLEERTRVARDIHDSVGHKLTALLMQLEIDSMSGEKVDLEGLKKLARDSLHETRQAVHQLKDEEVSGLSSVLQLIRKLESESHLLVRFTTEKGALSAHLSNEQSITLYRVIQEALTNAMKHSASRKVDILISKSSIHHLQFVIKSKDLSKQPVTFGFGLSNMKDRIEELGGELRVYQTEDQFVIEGSFPVKE